MQFDADDLPCRRPRHPGIAAVLRCWSRVWGRSTAVALLAGGLWFIATSLAWWMILVPGFLVHAVLRGVRLPTMRRSGPATSEAHASEARHAPEASGSGGARAGARRDP